MTVDHQSYVQHYIVNLMLVQCVISLDLSVLVEILSVVDSDHGTGPRRYKVNISPI